MHRFAKPDSYRIRDAAKRLGLRQHELRDQLDRAGAFQSDGVSGARRANPDWVRAGWLVERQQQYLHPHVGPQWYVRVEITDAGLDHLRALRNDTAA